MNFSKVCRLPPPSKSLLNLSKLKHLKVPQSSQATLAQAQGKFNKLTKLDFYYTPGSAPCRAIMLTCFNLELQLNYKFVNLHEKENLEPKFVKLNPLKQVPVLDDNGFVMIESRAIIQYLCNAYAKKSTQHFYPTDPKKRYLVDKMLNFDLSTLYASFSALYYPMIYHQAKFDTDKLAQLNENLRILDYFLEASPYAAGEGVTVADFVLIASLSSIETIHSLNAYQDLRKYVERCKLNIKGYAQCNASGVESFAQWAQTGIRNAKIKNG